MSDLIKIENKAGMIICFDPYGATLHSLTIDGNPMVLACDYVDGSDKEDYFGKVVGRYAGRIDQAKCVIDGVTYNLDKNDGNCSLHGGSNGYGRQTFDYVVEEASDFYDVIFTLFDKEQALPGDVNLKITYRVFKDFNMFDIHFEAKSTKKTVLNITNHAHFMIGSLTGVRDLELKLDCDRYTDLNDDLICEDYSHLRKCSENKIMDFQTGHKMGDFIDEAYLQNHRAKGYDHFFMKKNPSEAHLLTLSSDKYVLDISTTYEGVVLYSCNYPSDDTFNGGVKYFKHQGVAIEAQNIPNGINLDPLKYAVDSLDEHTTYIFKRK